MLRGVCSPHAVLGHASDSFSFPPFSSCPPSLISSSSNPSLMSDLAVSAKITTRIISAATSSPMPMPMPMPAPEPLNDHRTVPPSLLVFSGGTAFNGVVEELKKFTTRVAHVLPVSDDGGSTAEIVRVLGGPAVGDIRSRCVRLCDESTAEALAVKRLLGYRLPLDAMQAKSMWYEIIEGEHELWNGISGPYREIIRTFLAYFQSQIFRRSSERFSFANGSIGNFFFAGARIFFQSLEATIFLFSRVSHIPPESYVLPVICTNDRLTLGCELKDGTVIRGQNEISHPRVKDTAGQLLPSVNKDACESKQLPSPIKRIFYMSSEGTNLLHEVFPQVNLSVLEHMRQVDAIIYGMGSLFTSLCPSLVLCGVGELIRQRSCAKILLLNGSLDRETFGMSAIDFVIAISDALNRKYGCPENCLQNQPIDYINIMLIPTNGAVPIQLDAIAAHGIRVVTVESVLDEHGATIFEAEALITALRNVIQCFSPY